MSELQPCPFCGSKNIDPEEWLRGDGISGPGCSDCGATATSFDAWNTRHNESADLLADAVEDLGSYCELVAAIIEETHPGKAEALRKRMSASATALSEYREGLK